MKETTAKTCYPNATGIKVGTREETTTVGTTQTTTTLTKQTVTTVTKQTG